MTTPLDVVVLRMTGLGLLVLGAVAIAVGVLALVEHAVTDAAGTLAVSALLPFLG